MLPAQVQDARQSAAETLDQGAILLRLTRDLPGFLRAGSQAGDAGADVRRRIETREPRFLDLVARAIYGHPGSPYLALLRHAGCEFGDVRALVAAEGVEGALTILAQRGVYVTFDELKGRRDAVRGSRRFSFRQADFDNPLVRAHLVRYTGGSGGKPSRVLYSLDFVEIWATTVALALQAHEFDGARIAYWYQAPVHWLIVAARLGIESVGWFHPVHPLPARMPILARYLALLGRLGGQRFPLPRRCDLADAGRMADWVAAQLRSRGPLLLLTMPAAAARLSIAAQAAGHDLTGLTIVLLGEPVTEARRRHITASGARAIVNCSSVELTGLGYACAATTAPDDVHIMIDNYVVIQRERASGGGGPAVDALLVTGLHASAGKIAFNLEPGDYGHLAVRPCSCLFGTVGLTTHLSEIRSFEKLTSEGVTFARSHLQQILEEVLPARFGGTSLDYQIAEEEASSSATRLVVRVSPSIGSLDEDALRACLLEQLAGGTLVDQYQAGIWRSAGTVEIRREVPVSTRAGKVLPFHLAPRARTDAGRAR